MKTVFSLLLFFFTISSILCIDQFDIKEALRRQQEEKEKNIENLPPNIVMFTFYKEKKNEIDHFSRILKEFMGTIGVTANMVNVNDRELIATIPRGKTFDKNIVLDNFKGIIEKVDIADFTKN